MVCIEAKRVLALLWRRRRDERQLDERVHFPAYWTVLVLPQPAENAARVELVPAGQFEVPLIGLPLNQTNSAVER